MRRSAHLLVMATSVAAFGMVGSGPVAAAPPTVEQIVVDDSFRDDFLSDACGAEVMGRATGRIAIRTFTDRGRTGPLQLQTINIALTFSVGDRSVKLRDVGADLLRRTPDGSLVLSIVGQIPFDFTGVLKIDPDTGDVLHEPRNTFDEDDLRRFCAALTS